MNRLAALVLLTLAACAPRIIDAPGLTASTGRLGYYDIAADVILLDLPAIAIAEATNPGTYEWVTAHEQGHRATHALGLSFGPGLVGLERLAQCWAELHLGHGPPYPADLAAGYWDCPAAHLAQLRTALGNP